MVKKFTVFIAVLAFASFSSVSFACDTSCKGGKDKDKDGTELSSVSLVEGGGCGGKKCDDKKKGGDKDV